MDKALLGRAGSGGAMDASQIWFCGERQRLQQPGGALPQQSTTERLLAELGSLPMGPRIPQQPADELRAPAPLSPEDMFSAEGSPVRVEIGPDGLVRQPAHIGLSTA